MRPRPRALAAIAAGSGQRAGDRVHRAVERQFADDHEFFHFLRRQDAHGDEQAQRDGEVVMGALLGQVGLHVGGEVDQRQRDRRQDQVPGDVEGEFSPFISTPTDAIP